MGALSSAASGAASGAAAGSVVPGIGTAVGAGIGAAASLGSSLIGKHSNNNAIKTTDEAAKRAEQIAIDNENRRRDEYDRSEAAAKAAHDAEEARLAPYRAARAGLLQQAAARSGLSLGDLVGASGASGGGYSPTSGGTVPAPIQNGRSLAQMAGYGTQADPIVSPEQDRSLGAVWNWGRNGRVA